MAAANSVVLNPKPPDIKSFAQALTSNLINKSFASTNSSSVETPISSYKGEPAIIFSKSQIDKFAQPLKFSLIGKFPSGRPSLEVIRKVFATLNLKSESIIGLLDAKHILIRLNNEHDYHRIWLKEQWNIYQYPMRVFKWIPSFTPAKECPIIPTWILFPGLPPHLFDRDALRSIARGVGKPLQVDASTASLARPSVARICVEVDMTKPLAKRIWIGCEEEGYWQQVQYEAIPKYCKKCFKFGHEVKFCGESDNEHRIATKVNKEPKLKEPIFQKQRQDTNKNQDHYQQWVLVTNKKNNVVENTEAQTGNLQIENKNSEQGNIGTQGKGDRVVESSSQDHGISLPKDDNQKEESTQTEAKTDVTQVEDGTQIVDGTQVKDVSDSEEDVETISIHENVDVVSSVPVQVQSVDEDQSLIDRLELTGQDIMMKESPKASSAMNNKSHMYELQSCGYASDGKEDVDVEPNFNNVITEVSTISKESKDINYLFSREYNEFLLHRIVEPRCTFHDWKKMQNDGFQEVISKKNKKKLHEQQNTITEGEERQKRTTRKPARLMN